MEIISTYTRQQAIEDGQLFDITKTAEAKEAGFKIPICTTSGVYELIKVPKGLEGIQDFKGRLWDLCFMAVQAFKKASDKYLVPFKVIFTNEKRKQKTYTLWLCFNEHEGFTIMLPEEY